MVKKIVKKNNYKFNLIIQYKQKKKNCTKIVWPNVNGLTICNGPFSFNNYNIVRII